MKKVIFTISVICKILFGAINAYAQDCTQPHPGKKDVPVTGTLPVMYINTANNLPITQKEKLS